MNERQGLPTSLLLDANEHYRQWIKLPNTLIQNLHRYPDNTASALRHAMSESYCKPLSSENILITAGSIEAIDLLMRSLQPEMLIQNVPTYDVYSHCASVYKIPQVCIPYADDGQPDVVNILANNRKNTLLVMVHPNNPTGVLVRLETISRLFEEFEGIIVIDEAYIEYAGINLSFAQMVMNYPNLIVLRTFSKAWGLAGLRIGYVLAAPPMIARLQVYKNIYTVNAIALDAAMIALQQVDELQVQIEETLQNKIVLHERLSDRGFVTIDTSANFLVIDLDDVHSVHQTLLRQGIITRRRTLTYGKHDCLRVTVGSAEENEIFLQALIGANNGTSD